MIKTMYEKENTRIEKMGKKTMLIDQTKEKIKLMDDIINTNDGRYFLKSNASQKDIKLPVAPTCFKS